MSRHEPDKLFFKAKNCVGDDDNMYKEAKEIQESGF
jgi:hypothetical protein